MVHICYSYGIKANTDWRKTLDSEWRQYEKTFLQLQKSSFDIISLECHNSWVPMDLLEPTCDKKVMAGAIDVADHAVETPEEVAETLRKVLMFVDADKPYPSTNRGMAPLPRHVVTGKLYILSAGTKIVRYELAAKRGGAHPRYLPLVVSLTADSSPGQTVARPASCYRQRTADRPQGDGAVQRKQCQ